MNKKAAKRIFLNQSGFTLLEALIGSFIFTIAVLAVYMLLISAVRNNSHAMAVTQAATVAADKIEYLNSLPGWASGTTHADLVDGSHQDTTADGHIVNWVVDDIDAANKEIRVTVTGGRLGMTGARKNVAFIFIKGRDL